GTPSLLKSPVTIESRNPSTGPNRLAAANLGVAQPSAESNTLVVSPKEGQEEPSQKNKARKNRRQRQSPQYRETGLATWTAPLEMLTLLDSRPFYTVLAGSLSSEKSAESSHGSPPKSLRSRLSGRRRLRSIPL